MLSFSRHYGWNRRLLVVDDNNDRCNDSNDNDDENADKDTPPLFPVARARTNNRCANLLVTLCDVLPDFFALLLDVGDEGLLFLHDLVEVLEKLSELYHLALNVLDGVVALLDVAQGGVRLAAAV
jgi:hypothetical protein